MDYEKKYKEALELARVAAFNGHQSLMEGIFPELKESEDERIRKELIKVFSNREKYLIDQSFGDITVSEILTWLEKQGETVWSEETDDDAWLNDIISKVESGCTLNSSEIKWLKSIKDKINIHYWTEEEIEPIISDYLRGAEHYGGMIGRLRCLKPKSLEKQRTSYTKSDVDDAYLKGLSDAKNELEKQGEQKPAWSEKDEKEYKYVLKFVDNILNNCGNKKDYERCKRCYDWLKSLKDRVLPQPKQEWSEEEQVSEEFINALGTMLNDGLPDRYLVSEERIKKSAELLFLIARKQLKNEMQEWSE